VLHIDTRNMKYEKYIITVIYNQRCS